MRDPTVVRKGDLTCPAAASARLRPRTRYAVVLAGGQAGPFLFPHSGAEHHTPELTAPPIMRVLFPRRPPQRRRRR